MWNLYLTWFVFFFNFVIVSQTEPCHISYFSQQFWIILVLISKPPHILLPLLRISPLLYSLRKHLKVKASYTSYTVCPQCHSLYRQSECQPERDSFGLFSAKCEYVAYLNHPQQVHRKKCGTNLMKKVKVGQIYKFVPRKVYVYYSIIDTLQRLVSRPGFLELCEEWRKNQANMPNGYLTDIYDGRLWQEWCQQSRSFLSVPGNLLFMLNVDWFQPFDHTGYSVGVIYLVIQNLPRSVRY